MKRTFKKLLLDKLRAVECGQFDLANAVATTGVSGFCSLDYQNLKREVLAYCESARVGDFSYLYSRSRTVPCLYASLYAVLIEGLLGRLAERSKAERIAWGSHLNSFQRESDGLYYDPNLEGPAYEHIGIWNEGWGKHHLMGHAIIALARLGVLPKYPLRYLEWTYDADALVKWMDRFDFAGDVWTASNYFMNLYTVLEYARDWMNEGRAKKPLEVMEEWILKHQNPETGLWHTRKLNELDHLGKLKVVRAAYHFYPLFEYEGHPVHRADRIVRSILPLQNGWGGWTVEGGNSGACEDIDAIEPLIRFSEGCPELRAEIESAVKRSMVWQFACRNKDGGFSFYCRAAQEYGGHPVTTSLRDESSMFATWFRLLCLAYEMRFLKLENQFDIGRFPGYEIC